MSAPANPAITGHYVTVDNTRIYYDQLGEGPPLVCIHTAGSCSMLYHDIMPLLAAAGFRVIALDLPGHGKSLPVNWAPFTRMRDYAEFVWRFIGAVTGGVKPVVLGCSIGGNMVTDLAAHHSDGLVAAIAMAGGARVPAFDVSQRAEPHASPGWPYFVDTGVLAASHQPMRPGKDVELQWLHKFSSQGIFIGDLQCWTNHDVVAKMQDVAVPYLNIRGEADYFIDDAMVENTMATIPPGLGEALFLDRIGHYPHYEDPERIAGIIVDFLKRRGLLPG